MHGDQQESSQTIFIVSEWDESKEIDENKQKQNYKTVEWNVDWWQLAHRDDVVHKRVHNVQMHCSGILVYENCQTYKNLLANVMI